MTKHPCISFIPNGPGDKHGERGRSLLVGIAIVGSLIPPFVDGFIRVPLGCIYVRETKPLNERLPYPNCKAALEENVGTRFLLPIAKFAEATIWPTSSL